MTERDVPAGLSGGSSSTIRPVGWYRDKAGQRRFWNGVAWTDLARAITAFTVESEQAVSPPPPPPVAPRKPISRRTTLIVGLAVVVVALAIVAATGLMNTSPVRVAAAHGSSSAPTPSDTVAPNPPATTTTASLVPTTSEAPTTIMGGLGTPSPAVVNPVPGSISVAIIGDSITGFVKADLEHALRYYNLFIDAVGGSRMADHLPTIEQVKSDGQPRDWVIELGTNDALRQPLNTNWAGDFANEVAALQDQHCVLFVTVAPSLSAISASIDQAIASAVASHPNFHSIDWGNIEFRKTKWLQSDHLHPSASGAAELSRLEHKAILGCQSQ